MIIGSHVGMSAPNYLLGSVKEAISYQANTFMFYTGAPQNTIRTPLNNLKIEEAKALLKENHMDIENVIVHAPYLINLANCEDEEKYQLSIRLLKTEIERTLAIGCKYLVLHPGSALKADRQLAIQHIANALNQLFNDYPTIQILLEKMAGKGSEVGITFQEIKNIIDLIEKKECIGVCLDTCHIHDGGYDLSQTNELLSEFDQIIGLNYLKVCHINDSKNLKGAHKDRHANIGLGMIGFHHLMHFIYHPLLADKIFILETPWISYTVENQKVSYPPYRFEIQMIRNQTFNPHLIEDIFDYYYEKK